MMEGKKDILFWRNHLWAFLGLCFLAAGIPTLAAGFFSILLWIAAIATTTPQYDPSVIATWGGYGVQGGCMAILIGSTMYLKNKDEKSDIVMMFTTLLIAWALLGGLFLFTLWPHLPPTLRIALMVFVPFSFLSSLAIFLGLPRPRR